MKKYLLISLLLFIFTHIFTACSDNENDPTEEPIDIPSEGNILIAYFSLPERDGTDASSGASRLVSNGELLGNTQFIALTIQEATGADLFTITTVQPYPASHEDIVSQASAERSAVARPALATQISNIDNYDIIFIGYPNWWSDLPMPLYTFLEEYDFSSKILIPFNTHGGSGLSGTVNTIRSLQPGANVATAFTVSRNTAGEAANDVRNWLRQIGIIE